MTIGSVCSGIGAPEIAFGRKGFKPLWFSEIEKFPSAVLQHRFPDVPNLGDFTSDEAQEYMLAHPPDVFVGGTPCQAFSVAGKRDSLDDERGNLTLQFVRLWHGLRSAGTQFAVWENVPGVLNTKDNAFGHFLAGLVGSERPLFPTGQRWSNSGMVSGEGGCVAWRIIDAQFYGVPQRRRRVFAVIGHPGDFSVAQILFEPESVSGHFEKGEEKGQETAGSTGTGTGETGENNWIVPSLQARDYKDSGTDGFNEERAKRVLHSQVYENHPNDSRVKGPLEVCEQLSARNGTGGGNLPLVQEATYYDGSVQTGMVVRRLTPLECERLMGLPDGWTQIPWRGKPIEECPDGPRYKAIGNSIAVPCLEWIAERIKQRI